MTTRSRGPPTQTAFLAAATHIDRPRVFQGVLDPAAAAAPLSPNVSDRSYASDRRQRGQQRSRALKKQVDNMLHHAWCVDGSC